MIANRIAFSPSDLLRINSNISLMRNIGNGETKNQISKNEDVDLEKNGNVAREAKVSIYLVIV